MTRLYNRSSIDKRRFDLMKTVDDDELSDDLECLKAYKKLISYQQVYTCSISAIGTLARKYIFIG